MVNKTNAKNITDKGRCDCISRRRCSCMEMNVSSKGEELILQRTANYHVISLREI